MKKPVSNPDRNLEQRERVTSVETGVPALVESPPLRQSSVMGAGAVSRPTKPCGTCKQDKPLSAFSRCADHGDGLQTTCKECNCKYYRANRSVILEYHRRYQQANREVLNEKTRQYYTKNRQKILERQCRCRVADKRPSRAHCAVYYALGVGHLTRQPCEICGSNNVHAHHADYARPLDVRWLCPICHGRLHAQVHYEEALT